MVVQTIVIIGLVALVSAIASGILARLEKPRLFVLDGMGFYRARHSTDLVVAIAAP